MKRKKDAVVFIRLTKAEKEVLESHATKERRSVASFILNSAFLKINSDTGNYNG